jgi:NADP-dependent 3-hydroxy acid dehydrogenase YdfG
MTSFSHFLLPSVSFVKTKTGATNGIGKETARVLALRGAEVIIPARTLESGLKVKESLAEQVPASKLHVMEMDLSSLRSVCNFARSFDSSHKHLNILMYVWAPLKGCRYAELKLNPMVI